MAKILSKFGEQQLVMVNYACGFNQSETGKYFELIIKWFNARLTLFDVSFKTFQLLLHPSSVEILMLVSVSKNESGASNAR